MSTSVDTSARGASPEPAALRRLRGFEDPARRQTQQPPAMGYQSGLDGVRAVSVIAVLLYHAGFARFHGGFLGVEVFFVVSGYLITSLLLDERERTGRVDLGQFWIRRARRLLPALVMVLLAVGVWGALWGGARVQSDLRRDYPWAIFYAANWGQIVGGAQYFGNLSPLRHLWSLAVEEQWYLLWPLGFLGVMSLRARRGVRGLLLVGVAALVIVCTWWFARSTELTGERINVLYLSTFTRSSGLLLGAGAAFLHRPWRMRPPRAPAGDRLDAVGFVALAFLLWSFMNAGLTDRSLYRWQVAMVSLAALAVVMVTVHPAARRVRALLSWGPLVAIGKRSYGLYLWGWPISVALEAYAGSVSRFLLAMAVTGVVAECSYRFVETPVRTRGFQRWRLSLVPSEHQRVKTAAIVAGVALLLPMTLFYASADTFDLAAGGADVAFTPDLSGEAQAGPATADGGTAIDAAAGAVVATQQPASAAESVSVDADALAVAEAPAAVAPVVTTAVLPRRVVVLGDSQAHSLAINLPDGIEQTFAISDGSIDGCSVYDNGSVRSERASFSRSFADCGGWSDRWGKEALVADADVALVVLGAWDVFDVEVDGLLVPFGSAEADARFRAQLGLGIEAVAATGAHVALLEAACMRPQDVKGAGVPALPERGDDGRVAHLNELMREIAAADPARVTFVDGPTQWCADPAIAQDLGYRWDGVHVYKPGAKLIYETIAAPLLAIPVTP
ncbi:MAG: acyltransferase family protein [Actinomycetota bacterium]